MSGRCFELGGARAWWVWWIAVAFVVYTFGVQTGYSVVHPHIQRIFQLSFAQVSTIAAAYTWVFAVCQFFGGALLDRFGAHKVLPAAVALVTLGVFLFANANSYIMLLLSQFVLALGGCTSFVGAGYIGGQWFGKAKFGVMFGLSQFFASLSAAFSVSLLEAALHALSEPAVFNCIGVAGLVLTCLACLYLRDPEPVETAGQGGAGAAIGALFFALLQVAKNIYVWINAIICGALFGSLLTAGVVWAPKLMLLRGASHQTAALAASLLWVGLAAGSLVLPGLSDRIMRRKPLFIYGIAVSLLCEAVILYVPDLPIPVAMVLNFVFGFANAAHMVNFSAAAEVVPPQYIATSSAVVNGVSFVIGGIMIMDAGARVAEGPEIGLHPQTFAMAQYAVMPVIGVLVVALMLSVIMRESYSRS